MNIAHWRATTQSPTVQSSPLGPSSSGSWARFATQEEERPPVRRRLRSREEPLHERQAGAAVPAEVGQIAIVCGEEPSHDLRILHSGREQGSRTSADPDLTSHVSNRQRSPCCYAGMQRATAAAFGGVRGRGITAAGQGGGSSSSFRRPERVYRRRFDKRPRERRGAARGAGPAAVSREEPRSNSITFS